MAYCPDHHAKYHNTERSGQFSGWLYENGCVLCDSAETLADLATDPQNPWAMSDKEMEFKTRVEIRRLPVAAGIEKTTRMISEQADALVRRLIAERNPKSTLDFITIAVDAEVTLSVVYQIWVASFRCCYDSSPVMRVG